jgi:peptide/nickel transport system substrate-binding protein
MLQNKGRRKMKERAWKLLAAMLMVVLLPISLPTIIPNVTSAPQETLYGGTVKMDTITPGSLNPMTIFTISEWWHALLVYDRLATFDANLTVKPWLAYNWTVSPDTLNWTIHIVHNATWQDGVPLTAQDVKFTYDYIRDRYSAIGECSLWIDALEDVKSVETPDNYTVIVHLNKTAAYFETLTLPRVPIIPEHIWKDIWKPESYANKPPDGPIGSGPFKLVEFRPGEYARFVANEKYWRGRPYIDGILVKYDLTAEAEYMELKTGGLDMSPDTGVDFIQTAKASKVLAVMDNPGLLFLYISANQRKYPFNLEWFRQALCYAVDKQKILNLTYLTYGPVAWSPIAPAYKFWFDPNVTKYEFNLTKATELLDEHGFIDTDGDGIREAPPQYPGGARVPLKFTLTNIDIDVYIRAGDIISEDLKKIGIDLKNDAMELSMAGTYINYRQYDIQLWSYTCAPDPSMIFAHHAHEDRQYYSFGEWAYGNVTSLNEFIALYNEMRAEMNKTRRREIVFEMQEMLANELPRIPLFFPDIISMYRTDTFTGWYGPYPSGLAGPYNILTWLSVHMVPRPAGVTAGKWAKYGKINATWSSSDPNMKQPSNLTDMQNTEWIKNTIQTVSDTHATFQSLIHFKNGTEQTKNLGVDIESGEGNGTLMFLSKDLSLNDSIYTSAFYPSPPYYEWRINETVSRTYAGATRKTNHLNLVVNNTIANVSTTITTYNLYWDKATGALCEQAVKQTIENQTTGHITSWSTSFKITETNLWGAGTPIWIYAVAIIIVVAVVAGSAIYFFKIRKKEGEED